MANWLRLLLLAVVGPIVAHVVAALAYAPILMFTAVASVPIAVAIALILVPLLHQLFVRFRLIARHQLLVALAAGLAVGVAVHLLLGPAANTRLAVEYGLFGLLNALVCWAFYNWGPLRVTHAQAL
jgi:hypothetical protein